MAHSETLLISSIVRTGDMGPALQAGIDPELLKVHSHEWTWLLETYEEIGHVPDQAAFHAKWPSFMVMQTDDVAAHTRAVIDACNKSRLVKASYDALELLSGGHVDEAIQHVSGELMSIQTSMVEVNDSFDVIDGWAELIDQVEDKIDRVRQFGTAGIPTSWSVVDANTGGLQGGWLVIVGARPGVGKTYSMVRLGVEAAVRGQKVLYFSLEQSRYQIAMRAQSVFAGTLGLAEINSLDMLKGTVHDTAKLRDTMVSIKDGIEGEFIVNDTSRGNIGPIQIAAAIDKHKPDLCIVDYLTLLKMEGEGDWKSVGRLTADLKRIGERYEIPMVVGSQTGRATDGLPKVEDLAQADAIGQDADLVITLCRENKLSPTRKFGLQKNRHGPDGMEWYMEWRPGKGIIKEISGDEAERLTLKAMEVA
jgi:replicative DNA helicase